MNAFPLFSETMSPAKLNELMQKHTLAVQYSDAPTFLLTGVVGKLSGATTSVSGWADPLKPVLLPELGR